MKERVRKIKDYFSVKFIADDRAKRLDRINEARNAAARYNDCFTINLFN
ncbi:MAG: hypothetical protein FWG77_02345 [Treponema sp.]|nr:hypothetical protein [Treponema sp.]